MRVGVVNAVLSNTGDAAIFQALQSTVRETMGREASVDVVVFDSNAATTRRLYPGWEIYQQLSQLPRFRPAPLFRSAQLTWSLWWLALSGWPWLLRAVVRIWTRLRLPYAESLRALGECDIVVSSGGTYLVDSYDFTHRVAEIRVAHALGKHVVLWTQSMGPFDSARARGVIRLLARRVHTVCCRDERSADAWRSAVPGESRILVAPDIVFAIDLPPRRVESGRTVPKVAISVREWSRTTGGEQLDSRGYARAMRRAVETASASGWSCVALSTCQGVPDYRWDDAAAARRILVGLPVEIDSSFHTPEDLMVLLRGFDLVVATRMHVAIMALALQVPVIVVAYEFKTVELFASVGLGANCAAIESVDVDFVEDAIARYRVDPDSFILDEQRRSSLRDLAKAPVEALYAALSDPSR